ncbi:MULTISPECIES: hypothetical protein [unclassified Actinotalea]|uniref:hypothetical protein n=1 Tax=unclassified Actinotalea TaxID=2638618 RepID=UPI0015F51C89|nr:MULTISPECIES: hypothetical protein [unclassified Actinotalea]
MRLPTAVIAAAALVAGFAAAQLTDVRAAGAVVLLVGVAWCVAREVRHTPWWRLLVTALVGGACFAVSHLLADTLGPWPAVALAAVVLGGATWVLVDRPGRDRAVVS